MVCPYCGITELGTADTDGICNKCKNRYYESRSDATIYHCDHTPYIDNPVYKHYNFCPICGDRINL